MRIFNSIKGLPPNWYSWNNQYLIIDDESRDVFYSSQTDYWSNMDFRVVLPYDKVEGANEDF